MSGRDAVYSFIVGYYDKHGFPPTAREIQGGVGFASVSTVAYHVNNLKDEGVIDVVPNKARGIRLPRAVYKKEYKKALRKIRPRKRVERKPPEDHEEGCIYCKDRSKPIDIDHFYPLVLGGVDEEWNKVPACEACNRRKHGNDPVVWVLENYGQEVLSACLRYMHTKRTGQDHSQQRLYSSMGNGARETG